MTLVESSPTVFRQDLVLPRQVADPRTVVWDDGEQDMGTAGKLWERLDRAIVFGDGDVVLDMSGVTFLDASTIGVVVRACRHLRQRSRSLAVRPPSTCARRLFELCDLADLITPAPVLSLGPMASRSGPVARRSSAVPMRRRDLRIGGGPS
jgi:anti-sigma B factor antagonist